MQATIGDRSCIHGNCVWHLDKIRVIVEVHGTQGEPPYLVKFDDGHTRLIFPWPDAGDRARRHRRSLTRDRAALGLVLRRGSVCGRVGLTGRLWHLVIGCAVNAGAQLLWLTQIQSQPAYLTHLLPAQLLGGAGVGLTIPSLLGAGSASLKPGSFGTGSGILNMARQIGTVLGVAGLVAILSRVSRVDPVAAYRHGLILVIAFFAAAGAVSAILLAARPVPARTPATPVGPQEAGELIKTIETIEAERGAV